MARTTTSISVRGGREYVRNVKRRVILDEKDMGDFVRTAIDFYMASDQAVKDGFLRAEDVPSTVKIPVGETVYA